MPAVPASSGESSSAAAASPSRTSRKNKNAPGESAQGSAKKARGKGKGKKKAQDEEKTPQKKKPKQKKGGATDGVLEEDGTDPAEAAEAADVSDAAENAGAGAVEEEKKLTLPEMIVKVMHDENVTLPPPNKMAVALNAMSIAARVKESNNLARVLSVTGRMADAMESIAKARTQSDEGMEVDN